MKQKLIAILVVLAVAAVIMFYNTRSTPQANAGENQASDPQALMIEGWLLSALIHNGQPVALGDVDLTLQFADDGQAAGSAGCNRFFASYQAAADGSLSFGPVGATKMYCDNRMDQESAYLDSLSQISQFKTEQDQLILSSADGQTTLTYTMQ